MPSRNQDFSLGLTVIVLFGLFLATFFFLMRSPIFGSPKQTLNIHFSLDDGMTPLGPASPVFLRDAIKVGEVISVEVASGDAEHPNQPVIVVVAEIDASITLYDDCRITTNQPVIGGGGFVSILDVGNLETGAVRGDYIRGERPQSLQAAIGDMSDWLLASDGFLNRLDRAISVEAEGSVLQKVLRSLDDINAMTDSLRSQLTLAEQNSLMLQVLSIAENVKELTASLREEVRSENDEAVMGKVHVALESLNETLVEVRELVTDARPKIDATLTSVASAANKVDAEILDELREELVREDPESLLGRIHGSLMRADHSLENMVTITDAAEKLIILNRPELNRTIALIAEAADELNSGINELRTQPWRLLFPPEADEQAKVEAFQAARLFATAARELNSVSERLEALREAGDSSREAVLSEKEMAELKARLDRSFERFEEAEKYLWEQVK